MTSASPWNPGTDRFAFPRLETSLEVDVAIIGGGIAGVTTAYELTKAGKKVALLEQDKIAGGASGWTTAFVTQVTDASLAELRSTFGAARAELVWKSGGKAIDELERIIKTEKIDCDFMRCPAYIFANDDEALKKLHVEEDLARSFGSKAHIDDAPLGFSTPGYLRVDAQAKFDPVKFLTALAQRTAALGAKIFENTKVLTYSGSSPCIVKTEHGKIRAKYVVLATHIPNADPDIVSSRITAFQTYALEASVPSGILPEAIYWDTQKPYHYFRVDRGANHDRLILGGEDHKTGQSADPKAHFTSLENFLKQLLPGVNYEIVRKWSGEILETIDGLPYIGKTFSNKYILMATGFSGNGMTFGVLSGIIIRDLILERANATTKLYRTIRLNGLWHYMGRGLNFIIQSIKGRLLGSDAVLKDIRRDDGAIVEMNGKKVAVYKNAEGKILKLSPVCTHLKCIVQWNGAGKTWDCPCHGSRFKKNGDVLNGPASTPLEKIN